jgi:hypothetical protein
MGIKNKIILRLIMKNKMTNDMIDNAVLLYDIDVRDSGSVKQIFVCFFNEMYFKYDWFDDHDIIYKINKDKFYKEFKKLKHEKGEYNNEYVSLNFKTEDECRVFLNFIGFKSV